jgi:membrane dipeptidase
VDRAGDLAPFRQSGRIGIIMGMQNSEHFRTPEDVHLFHDEGQRISQLTYSNGNLLGSGCADRDDNGLSHFGSDVIRAMNETGMVIDVSHASERTTLDAIEASSKPVLITHSNCRALVRHPRCKSDNVIKALARKDGVMGITGVRAFLSPRKRATIEDVLDHFDHVAKLAGVEHLGIGSDAGLDATRPAPHLEVEGLHHPGRVFDLTAGLLRRGYSEQAVSGILGANFQRALDSILPPSA